MPIVKSQAFATIKELMERHIDIFQRQGFILTDENFDQHGPVGPEMRFHFFNERSKLDLKFDFTVTTGPRKGIFTVQIIKSRKDSLIVQNYLRIHGYAAEASLFVCTEGVLDFTKYAENFFSMLERVFENQLKPILSGKEWETTPIDWYGYK